MTSAAYLQQRAAASWPAAEVAALGAWRLRSSAGVTKRANSVLPLGAPGLELDAAIDFVEQWYADRSLPAQYQTFPGDGPARLEGRLAALGYVRFEETVFMTGPVVPASGRPDRSDGHDGSRARSVSRIVGEPAVELTDNPDDEWLTAFDAAEPTRWRPDLRGELLRRPTPLRRHAAVRVDGRIVSVGRCVVDEGWAGFAAVATAAEHRRRGHGRAVMAALADWAGETGAASAYLQVLAGNDAALALYRSLGFTEHHRYAYYARP